MDKIIRIEQINKFYGKNQVLRDIQLEINKGELVCLLGPSGCGKSTLLRILAGLELPSSGKVFLKGDDVTTTPPGKRNFGIVFQSYALFPNLTAFENVAYGLRCKKISEEAIKNTVNHMFEIIRLEDAKYRYPAQMSGGEQQRVALARALAVNPDFLLLDEPLSALDAKVRLKLRRQICSIQKELGLTTIMVTHDQDEALTMADRIVVMNRAEIMQSGTPVEIYENPVNHFVADFIGSINFIHEDSEISAIRPEHVHLYFERQRDSHHAVIKGIEFRGGVYRILAELTHITGNQEILIDVSANLMNPNNISCGKEIYIDFKNDKVLKFA